MRHTGGVGAFNPATDRARVDYQLLVRSPVRLVRSRALFDEILVWLRGNGYHIVSLDASWLATAHMFRDLGSALGGLCHDYWQCLSEALGEAIAEAQGRSAAGFVVALARFDVFATHNLDDAQELLNLMLEHAWPAAMLGRRVLCLAQLDEQLHLRKVGMSAHWWTDAELVSRRGMNGNSL